MLQRTHRPARRGAVMAEGAIVVFLFITLVLATYDVGVAVLRFNAISQAARHGVRQAIVHGSLAPAGWRGGVWGTTSIDAYGTATSVPAVDAVHTMLTGCDVANTHIVVDWPDGGNAAQ